MLASQRTRFRVKSILRAAAWMKSTLLFSSRIGSTIDEKSRLPAAVSVSKGVKTK